MTCPKCGGTKSFQYDHNHSTVCDECCQHEGGWWRLGEHHSHPGMLCCKTGCGLVVQPIYVPANRLAVMDIISRKKLPKYRKIGRE